MKAHRRARYWVVIPAAGSGKRMGEMTPKQYLKLKNKTMVGHAVSVFTRHPKISQVVVVLHADDTRWSDFDIPESEKIVTAVGGETRADSVMQGLECLRASVSPDDWVLVHDAARPCLTTDILDRLMEALQDHPVGGVLALPVADTLKKAGAGYVVRETVSRNQLWSAQTPQLFRFSILYDAMNSALASDAVITDDSIAIELAGEQPLIVKGDPRNIKVTHLEDLILAESLLGDL